MKDLTQFITEASKQYVISYFKKGKGHNVMYSDNWKSDIKKVLDSDWWEVLKNGWNFSEPEAVVQWYGEDSYWGNVVKNNTFKGRQLEYVKNREYKG